MTSAQAIIPQNRSTTDKMRLLNVQIFFRHGARTPLRHLDGVKEVAYPKSVLGASVPHAEVPFKVFDLESGESIPFINPEEIPYSHQFKGGMYAGMLTTIGKEQLYQLGQRLRWRYIDELGFVSKGFNSEEVFIRSSNVNRTIESLQCLIGGMFGVEQFKQNGPLKILVKHYQVEDLIPNGRNCRTIRQVGERYVEGVLSNQLYNEVLLKLQPILGRNGFFDLVQVYDHMISRKVHGLKLEQWMIDMEKDIYKAAIIGMHYDISGDKEYWNVTRPLAIGKVYQMVEDNMKSVINGDKSIQKFHLYSCHDITLFPLMFVLGDPMDLWPPFAADVRFELYQDNCGNNWVKTIFCDKDYIPAGCDNSLVPFMQFQEIIRCVKLTSDEYSQMCSDLNTAKELVEMRNARKNDSEQRR